ncbi:hypothetical protein GCM10011399_35540 [Subtercola lobariae]|uniref:Uncharacterized protein n=1 Tax=Subtercola lobariae TaxID=1588641 RepID=A0A917F2W6_9MICO|nr:hypothetical protein GCM10011399_35540 [Subtercola lobariae]
MIGQPLLPHVFQNSQAGGTFPRSQTSGEVSCDDRNGSEAIIKFHIVGMLVDGHVSPGIGNKQMFKCEVVERTLAKVAF